MVEEGFEVTDTSAQPLVSVQGISRYYPTQAGKVIALENVSFDLTTGKLVVVKGRSGSGKTTLLNLIGGLDQPDSGNVLINGQDLDSLNDRERTLLRRHSIGFVFQSFGLIATYSALENVEFALRLSDKPYRQIQKRAETCLKLVGLHNRMDHRPDELSGGQQQRLAIARALCYQPMLILADEPTGELDSETTHRILALFRRLVDREGVTVLLTSHPLLAEPYADQVLKLVGGRLVEN